MYTVDRQNIRYIDTVRMRTVMIVFFCQIGTYLVTAVLISDMVPISDVPCLNSLSISLLLF